MAGLHPAVKRAGSMPRLEAPIHAGTPSRSFQDGVASVPVHSKTTAAGFSQQPTIMASKDSHFLSLPPPSAVPGPVMSSWEQQAPLNAPTLAAAADGQQQLESEGGLLRPLGTGPSLLHLPSGEVGGVCGFGGSAPPKEIIPGNLHALIPSKFKYKFPRERIPRHKSYEVLAVEDNPYGPPPQLAPPPPKKPHKKKSIFGIAKRVQQQPSLHARSRYLANAAAGAPSMDAAMVHEPAAEAEAAAGGGQRGWVCDLKCFLCTSPDFASEEQVTLERENAQLDEALAEFQEATRMQAIELLETKKTYEDKLKENMRANQEAANDVAATKAALQEIQAERDRLLEIQRQTEESLFLIRQRMGAGLDALYHVQSKRSEELVEKMKHFCLGVTELLDKALPADKAGQGVSVAVTPEVLGPPPGSPQLPTKEAAGKKKKKGKKKVVKAKKTKKTAAGGGTKTKGKRTKVKRQKRMRGDTGPAAADRASPEQQLSSSSSSAAAAAATEAALHATTSAERVAHTNLNAASIPLALPLQPTGNSGQVQGKEVVQLNTAIAPAAAAAAVPAATGAGNLELVLYPGMSEKNVRVSSAAQQQDEASILLKQRLTAVNQQQQQQQQHQAGMKVPLRRALSADRRAAAPSPPLTRGGSLRSRSNSLKAHSYSGINNNNNSNSSTSNNSVTKHVATAAASPKSKGKATSPLRAAPTRPQQKREGAVTATAIREEEASPTSSPLGTHAVSAIFEESSLPCRGKSLGRLWTFKAPPPLPPGLIAKLKEHAGPEGNVDVLMRGITTLLGSI
ncbi:hypothetical protein ACSSS7_004117 [Eimeria intestinalis]